MKRIFSCLTITFSCITFGQQIPNYEIGNYVDYNKKIINGYYDFDYKPEALISISYDAVGNFTRGHYFDINGSKVEGFLKHTQGSRELQFIAQKNNFQNAIKAEYTKGFVIRIDTFSVVKNVLLPGLIGGEKVSDKSDFAENLENVGGVKFYKYAGLVAGNTRIKYLVKSNESSDFVCFPSAKDKFKKMAIEIFGSDPILLENISKDKYTENDIPTMIKIFKYRKLYIKNQNILYNSCREEINTGDDYTFYSKIESIKDSVFHLNHFLKNGIKIYEGNFTSFYPYKIQGDFLYYYPNGGLRRKSSYVEDKPVNQIVFFENGKPHRVFDVLEKDVIKYKEVYNSENVNILNVDGNGEEIFLDPITNRMITYEYENYLLKRAFFVDTNGEKIYQLCENNAEIKRLKKIQNLAKEKLVYPNEALLKNSHGVVFVKCLIEPSGLVSDIQIIKGLDLVFDKAVLDFLSCFKSEIYWKEGKVDDIAVKQEIIFPVDFSITTTSTYRSNYYNNYWFLNNMVQQQMMQQQQWMNTQQMAIPAGFR